MIDNHIIDTITDTADIVAEISDFVYLKRKGSNFVGLCPFHTEKTPSFIVSPTKKIWKCMGCAKGGDVIEFFRNNGMSFQDAARMLANKYSIQMGDENIEQNKEDLINACMEYVHLFEKMLTKEPLDYLRKQRGFMAKTIKEWRLGYCRNDELPGQDILQKIGLVSSNGYLMFGQRIIFPIESMFTPGKFIGFAGRILTGNGPKYINSPDTDIYSKSRTLYGYLKARKSIKELDMAIVVEGYTDAISMHQANIKNVVGSCGTALTAYHVQKIKALTDNIYYLFDGDIAGLKAAERGITEALKQNMNVRVVLLGKGNDPDDMCNNGRSLELLEMIHNAVDYIDFMLENATDDSSSDVIYHICKQLSGIKNRLEREMQIRKFASRVQMSYEAINAQVNDYIKKEFLSRKKHYY